MQAMLSFNLGNFRQNIQRIEAVVGEMPIPVVDTSAAKMLELSQELVPVRFGLLRGSGTMIPSTPSFGSATAMVMYSSFAYHSSGPNFIERRSDFDYAEIQHENASYHHNVGQAHYLSNTSEQVVTLMQYEVMGVLGRL